MRNPKKNKTKAKKAGKKKEEEPELMDEDGPSTSKPSVWRPGVDEIQEDEELQYDPTAYDCFHKLQLDWPCLSFDLLKDDLGAPRSAFPHTLFLVAGTQAPTPRQNYIAFVKLANLGQGRHGKRAAEAGSDDESSDDSDDDDEDEQVMQENRPEEGPAKFHYRLIHHMGGVNRIRCMPQQPAILAVWGDNGTVKILDGTPLVSDMAAEPEPTNKGKTKAEVKPLHAQPHSTEGFAVDWSSAMAGRLATGDCRGRMHVWDPQEGGRWSVSASYNGHESSVEDLQWSPVEETVLASCSVDKTIRVWDTRERSRPMITVQAHDTDVNVISWNRIVNYMLASGADDGSFRIWDLRNFAAGSHVSHFAFHKQHVTSIEWAPYESSMLCTCGGDNQLAVWDLALERDPEEEAALAADSNADAPEDLPAQLLFLHAGQTDLKEAHWHAQIPGMIASTAADGFNVFKASNM